MIRILIESAGVIGLGIIVFTLILRAIVLPIDIFQRIKMRKQSLIMKQMKPELEKLQQQYKNDNQTYSRKMMELYKKNGYSIFGACLPMIVSMVPIRPVRIPACSRIERIRKVVVVFPLVPVIPMVLSFLAG